MKRLVSWVVLWTVCILTVYSGWPTGLLLLIALFGLAGQWEFYRAQEEKGDRVFKYFGLFCGALIFFASWYFLIAHSYRADSVHLAVEMVLVLGMVGALTRLIVGREEYRAPINTAALTVAGLIYVPFLLNFLALLSFMPGSLSADRFLLIYLLAVTKFSDVGAYVIGSLWGRHKMIPRISPGKTWEGFAGAIATSLVISVTLNASLDPSLHALSFTSSVILGLLLPLVSIVGDLAESVVKRDAAIKDSGKTIPGIGGALDLIDSLLFTGPVLYFYLQFIAPVGQF